MLKKLLNLAAGTCELPSDVLLGEMLVSFVGERRVMIENYRKILFFDGHTLKLQGQERSLTLSGRGLCIDRYDRDELNVSGSIREMRFDDVRGS